jgi:hypothetical protein
MRSLPPATEEEYIVTVSPEDDVAQCIVARFTITPDRAPERIPILDIPSAAPISMSLPEPGTKWLSSVARDRNTSSPTAPYSHSVAEDRSGLVT